MDLSLSVVIIGRNEGQRLARCLESVAGMNYPMDRCELIYVDSNSSDGSRELASALGARVISIDAGKLTAARARNAGWRSAKGPLILFLDGDTILHPDFVQRAVATLAEPGVAVVYGNRRETHPTSSIYNRVLDIDWIAPAGTSESCGGDALMRRSALEQVAGYDADLIAGEEPDLCRRLRATGALILHIDAPMTGHDFAIARWSQYWRRATRTGYAYAEIAQRYRNTPDPLWQAQSRRNLIQAPAYLLASGGAIGISLASHSLIPIAALALIAAAIVVRTALRAAPKIGDRYTLLLYALHSHVQQFPLLAGQIHFYLMNRRNVSQQLIEYKDTTHERPRTTDASL